jgi:type I restriction enzyme M protein
MAEHLTSTGRAGIIVPEGIIFQSQTAYTQLRKMLVQNSLVAVISLPAGVFNPYSGVKTCILILDKSLARQSDTIALYKIENDGFSLGAQRREIDKNDLPQVKAELEAYLHALRSRQSTADLQQTCGLIVPKEKIAANGDYNLNGERYREGAAQSTHFPWRKVESLVETITPPSKIQKTAFGAAGRYPIIDQSQEDIAGWTDDESALVRPIKPLVIFGDHTCAIKLIEVPFAQGADGIKILQTIEALDPRFLFHVLRARPLEIDGYQRHFSKLKEHQIPLPPLDVQNEIVAEIEGYQKVIHGARTVLDHYRPHIPIHPDWPIVGIGTISTIVRGSSPRPQGDPNFFGGPVPRLMVADITRDGMYTTPRIDSLTEEGAAKSRPMKRGEVIITVSGNPGLPTILAIDACIHDGFVGLRELRKNVLSEYLYFALLALHASHGSQSVGAVFKNLTTDQIREFKIALPSLATQQAIVAEIKAEQTLVDANRELIARFDKKIQAALARIWGEDAKGRKE